MTDAPSMRVPPWWQFWRNPLIRRFARSQLRLRRSVAWILATLMVSSFVFFTTYLTYINRNMGTPMEAARLVLMPLFFIQGFVLMLMGTGSVTAGVVQDKISGTIDYQRLTPMDPLSKIVGYLFGLPIREYLLFALTLPFTAFCLWRGQIPLETWLPVYLVFFVSVVLYHITGLAVGMIAKKWRFTARLTQVLVILLYLVLPQFSQLGLYAFQYLTVRPVLFSELLKFVPNLKEEIQQGLTSHIESVPFFTWEFTNFAFSMALQSLLILTLGLMIFRKWKDQSQHAVEKRYGIGVFAAVVLLILGNLWPFLVRDSSIDLQLFGGVKVGAVDEGVGVALPLILALSLLVAGMCLLAVVTPTHHAILRGWRRAVKHGRTRINWWRDEATSGVVLVAISAMTVVAILVEMNLLINHDFFGEGQVTLFRSLYLPFAWLLAMGSFYVFLISLESRRIFMILLLGWSLPILFAVFWGAAFQSYRVAIYCAALSPAVPVIYGAGLMVPYEVINEPGGEKFYGFAMQAFWMGCVIHGGLIVWRIRVWRMRYRELVAIAKTGSSDVPASLLAADDE